MCVYYSKCVQMKTLSTEILAWIAANPHKFRTDTVKEAFSLLHGTASNEDNTATATNICVVNSDLAPLLFSPANTSIHPN
jgi:hypothetical protein